MSQPSVKLIRDVTEAVKNYYGTIPYQPPQAMKCCVLVGYVSRLSKVICEQQKVL